MLPCLVLRSLVIVALHGDRQKIKTHTDVGKKQSLHQETSAATSFRLWPSTLVAKRTSSSATGSGFHTSSLNGGNLGVRSCTGFGTGRPRRGRRGAVGGPRWMARCASRPCQNAYPKTVPKHWSEHKKILLIRLPLSGSESNHVIV